MSRETIKARLIEKINDLLAERIAEIEQAILSAKESRDSDTKSSAGDKYETGREMIQQEMDKQAAQLAKTRALSEDLKQIKLTRKYEEGEFGSLMFCNQGIYFLSVPLGKIELDGVDYYCISLASPIGHALLRKTAGESAVFNGRKIIVEEIF